MQQDNHNTRTYTVLGQAFYTLEVFIVLDVAFRKPISIDFLNASTFQASF